MAYKYILASINAGARKGSNPKNQYIELFQRTLDEQFYNSSNWWTIQEETEVGSKEYIPVDVRIAHVINAETGLKLGDDWKTLLFKSIEHPVYLGKHYIFENNTWLTTNTEILKNLTATATIRRCNNTMRWMDVSTGAIYEEPCCIEYLVKEPRNYATQGSPFITPGGFIHIEMQYNDNTSKIRQNQRFLFGNKGHWTAYKIIGTGVNDYRNMYTYDNNSATILSLDLIADYLSPEIDDIERGIANVYENNYEIILNHNQITSAINNTIQLIPSILLNGKVVERELGWNSSNPEIATVDGNGVVTTIGIGEVDITAIIKDNPASAVCKIFVSTTGDSLVEARLIPDINYILEGSTELYSVYLFENGNQLQDALTINIVPNEVPLSNFEFSIVDGNHFSVKNKMRHLSSYITIKIESDKLEQPFEYNINLKGAW